MVKGLARFQEHFRGNANSFVIIGGAACHEWFLSRGIQFRATKDIDMVLILEAVSPDFFHTFWKFIRTGAYKSCGKATGRRIYYRFTEPEMPDYPVMIELFSRKPMDIELYSGQNIVPLPIDDDISSLSAILMDDAYYNMVMELRDIIDGLPVVTPAGLIALKARAWLDLKQRRNEGQKINRRDIDKHRNDVFRLALLLPVGQTLSLSSGISEDLHLFLDSFPLESPEWKAISDALKAAGIFIKKENLLQGIRDFFML